MPDRNVAEVVHDAGDSANEVHDINTCQYAMETYPKGYSRVSTMGPMPDGGEWDADWHPQGANRMGNLRDDTLASDADKPADKGEM